MSKKPSECPYAAKGAVWCETQNCAKCGWNPVVAEARLEAIKQKLAEEAEKNEREKSMGKNPRLLR